MGIMLRETVMVNYFRDLGNIQKPPVTLAGVRTEIRIGPLEYEAGRFV
jgi:hypothetical protein